MSDEGERDLFSDVAQQYDKISKALTAGLDNIWRARAVSEAAGFRGARVLDVATGTGTVAIMLAKRYKDYKITGIDKNKQMLSVAIKKSKNLENVKYLESEVEAIKLPQNSFDIVISAFALGDFEDLDKALEQMYRVLRKGGKLILLDINKGRSHTLSRFIHFYRMFSLNLAFDSGVRRQIDSYLHSGAVEADEKLVVQLLKMKSFKNLKSKNLSFKTVFIITANK